MPKESPWFKFKVMPYLTGDIQAVSYHLKGVFADMMPYYWSRHCEMTYQQACRKFKSNNIDALVEAGIIKQDGDYLHIKFLDEQWAERQGTSSKNAKNGSEGARKRWSKNIPNASRNDGETMATAIGENGEGMANKNKIEKESKKESESEKINPPGNFFRINDQIFTFPPSEYFVTNFASFYENYQRTHKDLAAAALKKLDQDYGFGYTFNDVMHIRNAYKTTIEKLAKTKPQNSAPDTGYTRHQKPRGA